MGLGQTRTEIPALLLFLASMAVDHLLKSSVPLFAGLLNEDNNTCPHRGDEAGHPKALAPGWAMTTVGSLPDLSLLALLLSELQPSRPLQRLPEADLSVKALSILEEWGLLVRVSG